MVLMQKTRCILYIVIFLTVGSFLLTSFQVTPHGSSADGLDDKPFSASEEIYDNIDAIFTSKDEDFTTLGFYPQLYESSLQATYYGLSILDAIGKLEQVNETQIVNYIMSTYDSESHLFRDSYSYRYLDTDFTTPFMYPLTSLLQVHCYGVLSLELLNNLNLIDIEDSEDFIWSCYNPYSSGFIGQPHSPSLDYYAKISTMDNTYYAVKTLDILMGNWAEYIQERNDLVSYINSLQITNTTQWDFGGFTGDNESYFFPLRLTADANMFSSYYCIKTIQLFGMEAVSYTHLTLPTILLV